jgi:hypothetical protein
MSVREQVVVVLMLEKYIQHLLAVGGRRFLDRPMPEFRPEERIPQWGPEAALSHLHPDGAYITSFEFPIELDKLR